MVAGVLEMSCLRRNWTNPLNRLRYNREGGNNLGWNTKKIFSGELLILNHNLDDVDGSAAYDREKDNDLCS